MSQHFILQCIHTAHTANSRQDFDTAIWWCKRAIQVAPELPEAWFNLGIALRGKGEWNEAARVFQKTSGLTQDSAEAQNGIGYQLMEMGNDASAELCLKRAITLMPNYALPYVNLGIIRSKNKQLDEAIQLYKQAIQLQTDLAPAYINLGGLLNQQKKYALAEAACRQAIELAPHLPEAWNNLGLVLMEMNKDEAAACFAQCLALDPEFSYARGYQCNAMLRAGEWAEFNAHVLELETGIESGKRASVPFSLLMTTARPDLQRRAAEIYIQDDYPASNVLPPLPPSPRSRDRLKIGLFSADFRTHPVSQLICELLELLDQSTYELIAFSFGPSEDDPFRARITKAVDKFLDVREQSDYQVAKIARDMTIDIAIDLGGHTADARTGIFALRAAPIQASYLGFPGTLGASYMDYLICDSVVCPPGSEQFYTERLARLPHCFMPHDSSQSIADRVFTREEFDLPEKGFVFCCFNNHYKINPDVFDVWMRLLKKLPDSVLWLSMTSVSTQDKLRREASASGVAPHRLVFARRVEGMDEHLARYRLADLFLDTWPYNAHTTACDALWAGIPVLTCAGQTFSSRVAASLLTNIGLPDLITLSPASYEAKAEELAIDSEKIAEVRKKLFTNRLAFPLFDTPRLARDMGRLFNAMVQHSQDGLAPIMLTD